MGVRRCAGRPRYRPGHWRWLQCGLGRGGGGPRRRGSDCAKGDVEFSAMDYLVGMREGEDQGHFQVWARVTDGCWHPSLRQVCGEEPWLLLLFTT